MLKKITTICLVLALVLSLNTFAFAATNVDSTRTIVNNNGETLTTGVIAQSEVPEGIVPLKVDSVEEADNFIKSYTCNNSNSLMASQNQLTEAGTSGDILVDQVQLADILTSGYVVVQLRLAYSTSGPNNTGAISYANPYITKYGFPIFADWTTQQCSGYPSSEGKDYYSFAIGQVDYYFIINGITRYYTQTASLSGWSALIH